MSFSFQTIVRLENKKKTRVKFIVINVNIDFILQKMTKDKKREIHFVLDI